MVDPGSGRCLFWVQRRSGHVPSVCTCHVEVRKLGKRCDGVLFCTYAMLVSARSKSPESHTDPGASRFGQVLSWLTHRSSETKGEGLICFDEAHKAKNLDQNTKASANLSQAIPESARNRDPRPISNRPQIDPEPTADRPHIDPEQSHLNPTSTPK